MILPQSAAVQNRQTDNVSITVKIDGKDVTMSPGGLVSLSIGYELNRIPWARLVFSDGAVEKQEFAKSNQDLFAPGKTVEVLLGYDQNQDTIFKGIIIRHAVRVQQARHYRLELECRHMAIKSTATRQSRYFHQASDKDAVQELLQIYPDISVGTLEDPGYQHEELVQYNVTDWDFILLRADANGYCLTVKDDDLNMIRPEIKPTADVQVQFGIGGTGIPLLEFESALDARDHYPSVKGSTWDYTRQEVAAETSSASGTDAAKNFPGVLYNNNPVQLYHGGDMASEELSAWVDAKQQRGDLSHVKGRVAINGIKVLPGDTLEVNGIGDRFNGLHLVSAVIHQVVNGTWKTDIQFGWDRHFVAEKFEPAAPDAAGLAPGIRGLHAGIVSKIAGDSRSGDYRVQVRIPYVAQNPNSTSSDGIWARVVNIYAGNNRGFVFRPEIDDEVIIGFINNDPNDAVVLGSVHSDKNVAPSQLPADDKNPKKGLISNAGMQFIFDDDGKKITLSAGDDNSPKIVLDGSGQSITIQLDASNSIEISSSGVTVKGTRIDLN